MEVGKIYKALQNVNDELEAIKKDQKGFNYNFRGIDKAMNAMNPLFKKHGILVRRSLVEGSVQHQVYEGDNKKKQNHVILMCNYHFFSTEDGSEVTSLGFGEGMDKGDKALACAISNSYKYVIFEMFNIATEEQIDSDMKTAQENGVDPNKKVEPPKKTAKPASPTKSFRDNPVKAPVKTGGL